MPIPSISTDLVCGFHLLSLRDLNETVADLGLGEEPTYLL